MGQWLQICISTKSTTGRLETVEWKWLHHLCLTNICEVKKTRHVEARHRRLCGSGCHMIVSDGNHAPSCKRLWLCCLRTNPLRESCPSKLLELVKLVELVLQLCVFVCESPNLTVQVLKLALMSSCSLLRINRSDVTQNLVLPDF